MILAEHFIIGAAITSVIPYPLLGLTIAFFSHYFLDFLPHREYAIKNIYKKRWKNSFFDFLKVFLDIALGVSVVFFFSRNQPLIYLGGILSLFPDGFTLLNLIFPKNELLKKHYDFHRNLVHRRKNNDREDESKKNSLFWGLLSQVLLVVIAIFLLRPA